MKRRMFLVFSHTLTKAQERDAKERFGIEDFINMPDKLKYLWSNVNPNSQLAPLRLANEVSNWLISQQLDKNDVCLVQGDFVATYILVDWLKRSGVKAVYATTKRNVVEKKVHGKIVKTSVFEHIMFREYRGANE